MESEFIAAESPAILMVTPFMYEGLDFPEGTADRLILDQVPFDHPNNPVMSKRKERYRSSFTEYAMPRVEFRLFRLLRSFCRHRKDGAEVMCFDKRLLKKTTAHACSATWHSSQPTLHRLWRCRLICRSPLSRNLRKKKSRKRSQTDSYNCRCRNPKS